jgi:hypothetical protein
VVLSDRGLKENQVEYQHRTHSEPTKLSPSEAVSYLLSHVATSN